MNSPHRNASRHSRKLLTAALAACLTLAAPVALAQSAFATLQGRTAGGGSVTVTNVDSGLTRTATANSEGRYAIPGLPPGTYNIQAAGTTRTVVLAVGQTATLDLTAPPPSSADVTTLEGVEVRAELVPETRTSEVASYVSSKTIEALPQATRNFLAFADNVPGMVFNQDPGGNTSLRSGAQTASAINVFIDGVGQKNYVLTGGISGQDSSRGNPFPQAAIGEYKVITSNYKAEYDQLSSAAIVAVTRNGSNKFSGNVFWDRTDSDWRSRSVFEQAPAAKRETMDEQYGVSFGGPIVKDALHFFLAYEAKRVQYPIAFNLGRQYNLSQLPPEFAADFGDGNYVSPFQQDMYFGKIDWAIGNDHYLEFTARAREESELIDYGGLRMPSAATDKQNNERRADLRYQWTFGDFFNDAHIGYEKTSWSPRPQRFENGYWLADGNWWDTIAIRGGGENYQDKGQKGWLIQDDLTWRGLDGHTIKGGVKFKSITMNTVEQLRYNPQFYYDIHHSLTVPTHVQFGAPAGIGGDGTVSSKNRQFGVYIQDDWEVNDHLTLNLGVRWDYERTPSYEDYVTPADVVAAMRASNANQPGSGIDINDYISTGSNRKADKNNWAPRLGFSYDINADQRSVIFGGIGRAYDRNLFDYLQNEVSKGTWGNYHFDFNTPGHACEVGVNNCLAWDPRYLDRDNLWDLATAIGGREVYVNHNDLVVPYSDQVSLGMRNILAMGGHDWTLETTLSRIESHDGIAFLLGNRRPDGSFFPPGASDPPPWGQGFAPFSNLVLAQNALETKSNSFLLRLEKPYTTSSGWAVNVAYTFTDSDQNSPINGWPGAFNQATIGGYGWFPGMAAKHRLVTSGIYDGPWGITLSGKLTYSTALPRYVQDCNEASWSLCHFTYYFPDRGEFRQLDLAAQKEFNLGGSMRFRLRADMLNVFNWANYVGFDDWMGGANEPLSPGFGTPNAVALPTRTFKLTAGFSW